MPEHPLKTMRSLDPRLIDHLAATEEFVYADGALPPKIKLPIAMAFDAALKRHAARDIVIRSRS
jgi:hypothetical protein